MPDMGGVQGSGLTLGLSYVLKLLTDSHPSVFNSSCCLTVTAPKGGSRSSRYPLPHCLPYLGIGTDWSSHPLQKLHTTHQVFTPSEVVASIYSSGFWDHCSAMPPGTFSLCLIFSPIDRMTCSPETMLSNVGWGRCIPCMKGNVLLTLPMCLTYTPSWWHCMKGSSAIRKDHLLDRQW